MAARSRGEVGRRELLGGEGRCIITWFCLYANEVDWAGTCGFFGSGVWEGHHNFVLLWASWGSIPHVKTSCIDRKLGMRMNGVCLNE